MFRRPGRPILKALAGVAVVAAAPLLPASLFIRGDLNGDTTLDISDPIATLLHLFEGGPAPDCRDAGDANDDGMLDITDALYALDFLFRGGPAPGFPFPYCDEDPTPDDLDCGEYACPPVENEIVAIRSVGEDVEIELSSSRPFPARALHPVLCIEGALASESSRHPDGDMHAIVFTLAGATFDAAEDGALVTVQHGVCSEDLMDLRPYWDLWVFGPLDKGILDA